MDGEQALTETVVDREDEHEVWLRGNVPLLNPVVNYRWLLDGVPGGYQWLNGEGVHARDVTDAADFRLSAHPAPPAWAQDAVLYQIFPDRFAKSIDRPAPGLGDPAALGRPDYRERARDAVPVYGGDLDGITAHLDHIARTGANTVYLTPVFPARSNHRYDAIDVRRRRSGARGRRGSGSAVGRPARPRDATARRFDDQPLRERPRVVPGRRR